MDKEFSFLFVTLESITFQAVGNVAEIGLPAAVVSEGTGQFVLFVTAEIKVSFIVGTQQVGVELLTNHLVGNGEFGFPFICATDSEHTEIIE